MGVGCNAESAEYLRMMCIQEGGDLRPYLPADVCKLVKAVAQYEGTQPTLSQSNIDRALGLYYTQDPEDSNGHGKSGNRPSIEKILDAHEVSGAVSGPVSNF